MSARKPPIIAYHIIFGAYGFWLPNDPRGSWSKYVFSARLQQFGQPEKRARHEPDSAEEALRAAMKEELQYPAVRFTGVQARAVGRGFAEVVEQSGFVMFAAALMPDHVHLVIGRQRMLAETMTGLFKRSASKHLRREELHPLAAHIDPRGRMPSPWERLGWKVFLHTAEEIELAMLYVNQNPIEAGLPQQNWSWVKPVRL